MRGGRAGGLGATKVGADAALDRNRDGAWIRGQVTQLLAATAVSEQTEAPAVGLLGLDATGELACRKGRLARLKEALAVIEAEEKAAADATQAKAKAARVEAEAGRKLSGRKPKGPAAALVGRPKPNTPPA